MGPWCSLLGIDRGRRLISKQHDESNRLVTVKRALPTETMIKLGPKQTPSNIGVQAHVCQGAIVYYNDGIIAE